MKAVMIVHSLTGNTLSVAEKFKGKLKEQGIDIDLVKVEPLGGEKTEETDITKIRFENMQHFDKYDYVIIGGPVRGFSMSPVLKSYLHTAEGLEEKKCCLFVTHFFPLAFLGGKTAVGQMKKAIEARNGEVIDTGIIDWKNPRREKQIDELLKRWSQRMQ